MIGFSIEFKRWYFVLRGPRGRVYLATGFARKIPSLGQYPVSSYDWSTYWSEDETDEDLIQQLKDIR
jgi:hypothetical protein